MSWQVKPCGQTPGGLVLTVESATLSQVELLSGAWVGLRAAHAGKRMRTEVEGHRRSVDLGPGRPVGAR